MVHRVQRSSNSTEPPSELLRCGEEGLRRPAPRADWRTGFDFQIRHVGCPLTRGVARDPKTYSGRAIRVRSGFFSFVNLYKLVTDVELNEAGHCSTLACGRERNRWSPCGQRFAPRPSAADCPPGDHRSLSLDRVLWSRTLPAPAGIGRWVDRAGMTIPPKPPTPLAAVRSGPPNMPT